MRRAFTLLEVLVAAGILMFGLLAVAAGLVVGLQQAADAQRIDRASTLSRAAIDDLFIQGWLDRAKWNDPDAAMPVILDPVPGLPGVVAGVQRVAVDVAARDYTGADDVIYDQSGDRPTYYQPRGEYTWFATVSDRCVTAVACHKRTYEERSFPASVLSSLGGAISIETEAGEEIRQGEYVLLVWDHAGHRHLDWYKGSGQVDNVIDLQGPDLPQITAVQCVVIDGVSAISRDYVPQVP